VTAVAAIAARHGVPTARVRELPASVANHVYLLGEDLVLRIPRERRYVPDLVKEAEIRWLTGWFDRLSPLVPARPGTVLIHGDVAPQNLLVTVGPATLTGLIDWGDGGT